MEARIHPLLLAQPKLLRVQDFPNVHPLIKKLFLKKKMRFPMYLQQRDLNFKKLTTDPVILSYVEGYKILLVEIPSQNSSPPPVSMNEEEKMIVQEEVEEMQEKKAIAPVKTRAICKNNFHSPEEIYRISISNKFEESKLLCRVKPF